MTVCVSYRNPGPWRGEPRVGSGPNVAFPVDPLDPAQNSVKLICIVKTMFLDDFHANWGPIFGSNP